MEVGDKVLVFDVDRYEGIKLFAYAKEDEVLVVRRDGRVSLKGHRGAWWDMGASSDALERVTRGNNRYQQLVYSATADMRARIDEARGILWKDVLGAINAWEGTPSARTLKRLSHVLRMLKPRAAEEEVDGDAKVE